MADFDTHLWTQFKGIKWKLAINTWISYRSVKSIPNSWDCQSPWFLKESQVIWKTANMCTYKRYNHSKRQIIPVLLFLISPLQLHIQIFCNKFYIALRLYIYNAHSKHVACIFMNKVPRNNPSELCHNYNHCVHSSLGYGGRLVRVSLHFCRVIAKWHSSHVMNSSKHLYLNQIWIWARTVHLWGFHYKRQEQDKQNKMEATVNHPPFH